MDLVFRGIWLYGDLILQREYISRGNLCKSTYFFFQFAKSSTCIVIWNLHQKYLFTKLIPFIVQLTGNFSTIFIYMLSVLSKSGEKIKTGKTYSFCLDLCKKLNFVSLKTNKMDHNLQCVKNYLHEKYQFYSTVADYLFLIFSEFQSANH